MLQTEATRREWLTVGQFLTRNPGTLKRNTIYAKLRQGVLPSIRLGKRFLIPSDALEMIWAEATK